MTPRVALITGAARGIGSATVVELAGAGWSVVAVDSCADDPALAYPMSGRADLDSVVATARAAGGRVVPVVADVRHLDALAEAVATAENEFGGLDAAIACAGVIAGGVAQWELSAEVEQAVLDVNLVGVLNLARVSIPALLRRPLPRSGRFVAIGSAAATRGMPMIAAYSAAKAGVGGLIRSLASELGGTGVTANAVNPGSTATPILDESARLYALDSAAEFAKQQPVQRLLAPAEIAAMVAFLAGPTSSGITGAVVAVDGGLAL